MKMTMLKWAVAATLVTAGAPAFADLIYVTGTPTTGTGLGAVNTVVTVQDNGSGPRQNGTESGCVTYSGNNANPTFSCSQGLQGGDNTAINKTYFLSDIAGLTSASQLGLVVNISEGAPDNTAILTDLYLSLFNTTSALTQFFSYTGPDLPLLGSGGIGQSGFHRFILDDVQANQASAFCPVLANCVLGAGVQFAEGTTQATPETVYVKAFERDDGSGNPGGTPIPEPGSIVLLGAGALAITSLRRRRAVKN
jgi:hypothetical protein